MSYFLKDNVITIYQMGFFDRTKGFYKLTMREEWNRYDKNRDCSTES